MKSEIEIHEDKIGSVGQTMKPICWRRSGALMVSCPIPGVTQDLNKSLTFNHAADSMRFYAGRYFVCESITIEAAKAIAKAMGWKWSDKPIPHSNED